MAQPSPEHICRCPIGALQQFRGHVAGVSLLGLTSSRSTQLHQQPKVTQLAATSRSQEDVGRLDIKVNQALAMQMGQSEQGVPQVAPDLGLGQAGAPGLTVLLQAGSTQLCLQVQDAALLPGSLQPHTARVLSHLLMATDLCQLAGPVLGAPEWRHGAFHCIEPAIFLGAHLEER